MSKDIRQLAAIMFCDIVNYTAIMQNDEKDAVKKRERFRKVVSSMLSEYNGKLIQYYGDGVLNIFSSAVEAVKCGIKIQTELINESNVPSRIGIHIGDIVYNDAGAYGDGVNVASRIESRGEPGSVLISDKVYDEIKNHTEIKTSSIGRFNLKNVDRPVEIFAIVNEGLKVPKTENELFTNEIEYPIIETKLYVPKSNNKLVYRKNLLDNLNSAIDYKLILISAPAGFGKTTLVSDWISNYNYPAAWISLDKTDNDPVRFIHYVIGSFRKIKEEIGGKTIGFLQASQNAITDNVLTALVGDISTISSNSVLVLDDYHSIDNKQIHHVVEFLIDHLPNHISVIITTRADPPLPIPRLRVRNHLKEIRTANLSFTIDEAVAFFNNLLNLKLSENDINVLEQRTEGWIAGLQLAALSIKGQKNVKEYISSFAGDARHIVDYLAEEVLNIQSEQIQEFLLQTSILNRLSESLCNYVVNTVDSRKILDELERINLFIIPLDDKRNWFRYHHLFADLLKQKLFQRENIDISELHMRASQWYEENDQKIEAFHHAINAGNYNRAADLLELAWPEMDKKYQSSVWINYVKQIPDEIISTRPVLSVAFAWALLDTGELEKGEAKLDDAQYWLDLSNDKNNASVTDEIVIVDNEQYRYLPASIANARAYFAQAVGDIENSISYALKVFEILGDEEHHERDKASAILGIAYWYTGKLNSAQENFYLYMNRMRKAGNIVFALMPVYFRSFILLTIGQLNKAIEMCDEYLQIAQEHSQNPILSTADLYLGLSELFYEKGDKKKANDYLLKSENLSAQAGLPDWNERYLLIKARYELAENNFDKAIESLEELKRIKNKTPVPDVRPADALIARVNIKKGKLEDAAQWIKLRKISADANLNYFNEYEYITYARYLIEKFKSEKNNRYLKNGLDILNRLLCEASSNGRKRSEIEILILLSFAYSQNNENQNGEDALIKALLLAEPESYEGVFIEEGDYIKEALENLLSIKDNIPSIFINKLLTSFKTNRLILTEEGIFENLSEREIEVLKLIEAGFSNKRIVDELYVSMSTVKTHLRNIYGKLNVHSRTEAIAKAKELNFI